MYHLTCDENSGKIKVPFQLLVLGCHDKVTLKTYSAEITHAPKVAESTLVTSTVIKIGTRKRGWSEHKYVNQAKRRLKMCSLWRESSKPRSGMVFNLFHTTKRNYKALLNELKVKEAEITSEEAICKP